MMFLERNGKKYKIFDARVRKKQTIEQETT